MAASEHPPGFKPFRFNSPFLDLIGPVYARPNDAGITIGLCIAKHHCNRRGTVHGGVLSSIADVTLGYSAGHGQVSVQLTTIAINIEFLRPARLERWIESAGSVTKFGRSTAHACCMISSDGLAVARATGVFKVHRESASGSDRSASNTSGSSQVELRLADDK